MAFLVTSPIVPLYSGARPYISGTRPYRCSCSRKEDVRGLAEDEILLEDDMKRLAALSTGKRSAASKVTKGDEQQLGVRDIVNKILVADFFFVLLSLAGLVVGLGEKATLNSSNVLDVWYSLWPVVFQPALGLLMAGILLSQLFKG